ncbi:MAG: hypothetical protein OXQ29_00380 [Rhodospirillaceae bacterium]|nr:hypothetical protein [Rhodospirillaceae bacterium]
MNSTSTIMSTMAWVDTSILFTPGRTPSFVHTHWGRRSTAGADIEIFLQVVLL